MPLNIIHFPLLTYTENMNKSQSELRELHMCIYILKGTIRGLKNSRGALLKYLIIDFNNLHTKNQVSH